MKKIKIIIILLITAIVIIGIILFNINSNNSIEQQKIEDKIYTPNTKVSELFNESTYYTAQSLVQRYVDYISQKDYKAIYEILDTNYKNENRIDEENVLDKIELFDNKRIFKINKVYKTERNNTDILYMYGTLANNQNSELEDYYVVLNMDYERSAFSIKPITKEIYDLFINNGEFQEESYKIEQNNYNKITYQNLNDFAIAVKYLSNYRDTAIFDQDTAYNLLEEKYREKRFGSLENYKKYINQSLDILQDAYLSKYIKNVYNDYTEYVCVDQYGNYFIFKVTSVMNYTLTLDTYTLEYEKFTTEYAKADESKKAMMNIDKFFQMINARDYRTSYKVLDDGFKNNYFKTEEEFANYMKTNFFKGNKIEFKDVKNEGNILIYTISITDTTGQNTQAMEKTFIIKLEEGTDFVLSFNVE